MRIAVYFRTSTQSQTIENQRNAIDRWLAENGVPRDSVIEYTDAGISGAIGKSGRRGLQSLIGDISSGKLDKILVFEGSRISRDFMEYLKFLDLCKKNGAEVEIVGKGAVGFESSQDLLLASVAAYIQQAEREEISRRTKAGLERAKAAGKRLGRPRGRKSSRPHRKWSKSHSPHLVREILMHRGNGLSYRQIAELISDRFTPKPISHMTVSRIVAKHS